MRISQNLNCTKQSFSNQLCSNAEGKMVDMVYPSGAPEFTPGFCYDLCCSIFNCLCSVLQIIVFCTFSFGHSVLCPFTAFYYSFGILLCLCLFCWKHTIYTDRSLQPNVGSSRQTVQIIKFNSTFVLLFLYQNHSFTRKSSLTW